MRTNVRTIGNSRGILIPAAFLASCQIEDQVDLQLEDGQIVIKPVKRVPRAGWFDALQTDAASDAAAAGADAQAWEDAALSDDSEWTW